VELLDGPCNFLPYAVQRLWHGLSRPGRSLPIRRTNGSALLIGPAPSGSSQ
jgi:hypothetical protein